MTTGWICPKCGCGCAPSLQRCPCALPLGQATVPTVTIPNALPEAGTLQWPPMTTGGVTGVIRTTGVAPVGEQGPELIGLYTPPDGPELRCGRCDAGTC